jgi:hypothetical protein
VATATLETEFCGQRLSSPRDTNERQRRWKALGRPWTPAASRENVVLFCGLGNHVNLRGLPGGGRSPEKLVSVGEFPGAADNPARQAFVSELVDQSLLRNAVILNSILVNIARVIGPTIAAFVRRFRIYW